MGCTKEDAEWLTRVGVSGRGAGAIPASKYHSRMHAIVDRHCLALMIIAAAMAMGPVSAAEVYRWTDADGRVHYGSRPPQDAAGARSVELPEAPGGAARAADLDSAQRRDRQRRLLEAYSHERRQKQAAAAESAERRQEQERRCRALQAQWRRLAFSGPVYFKRDDGTRDFLSDERRAAEQARLRPVYIEVCGEAPP
jgi:hypothetical protein